MNRKRTIRWLGVALVAWWALDVLAHGLHARECDGWLRQAAIHGKNSAIDGTNTLTLKDCRVTYYSECNQPQRTQSTQSKGKKQAASKPKPSRNSVPSVAKSPSEKPSLTRRASEANHSRTAEAVTKKPKSAGSGTAVPAGTQDTALTQRLAALEQRVDALPTIETLTSMLAAAKCQCDPDSKCQCDPDTKCQCDPSDERLVKVELAARRLEILAESRRGTDLGQSIALAVLVGLVGWLYFSRRRHRRCARACLLLAVLLPTAVASAQDLPIADPCTPWSCPTPGGFGAPPQSLPLASPVPPLPVEVRAAVVRIRNKMGNGQFWGSGTLVEKNAKHGLILTCAHLFSDGVGTVEVYTVGGRTYGAKLLGQASDQDLAVLMIATPAEQPVVVATAPPRNGESMASCGFGSAGQFGVSRGHVVGYVSNSAAPGGESLEISGFARHGDSGGPIFNERFELTAVLYGTDGRCVDGTCCHRVRDFLGRFCQRFRGVKPGAQPGTQPGTPTVPAPIATAPPTVPGPQPYESAPYESPAGLPVVEVPAAPAPAPDKIAQAAPFPPASSAAPREPSSGGGLDSLAQGVATTLGAKLLTYLGLASGPAGLLAAGASWIAMRRLKRRLADPQTTAGRVIAGAAERVEPYLERVVVDRPELHLARVPTTDDLYGRMLEAMKVSAQWDPKTVPAFELAKSVFSQLSSGAPLVEKLREKFTAEGSKLGWQDKPKQAAAV